MWTKKTLLEVIWKIISIVLKFDDFLIWKYYIESIYNRNLLNSYIMKTFNSPNCESSKCGLSYLNFG